MRLHLRTRSSQSGFTLMEITISVVLLGILGVVGTTMMSGSFYTTRVISTEHLAYSAARYAMERMTREIREMQYDTANNKFSVSTMTNSQLSFLKTGLSGMGSDVSFQYFTAPQSTLTMAYGTTAPIGSPVLAKDVSNFSFEYLQSDGVTPATTPENIRSVHIVLTVSPADAQALTLRTRVNLRNL